MASYDASHTEPAHMHKPIEYPPFQPPLSTDLMTSVSLTGTNHAEDQPVHLRVVRTEAYSERVGASTLSARPGHLNPATGAGTSAVRSVASAQVDENGMEKAKGNNWVEEEGRTRREHVRTNVDLYAGLLGRACPAGVYEYVEEEGHEGKADSGESWKGHKLVINSQVCLLCTFFPGGHALGYRCVY